MGDGVKVVNEHIIKNGRSLVYNEALSDYKDVNEDSIFNIKGALQYFSNNKMKKFVPETIFDVSTITEKLLANSSVSTNKIIEKAITKSKLSDDVNLILSRSVQTINGVTDIVGDVTITKNLRVKEVLAERCYNPVYADFAEAFVMGEDISPGQIVALRNGKAMVANQKDNFIIGVASNEYGTCYGAIEAELWITKVPVALIGKVHIKIANDCDIKEGYYVYPYDNGYAIAAKEKRDGAIARIMEKTDRNEAYCLIKASL